MCHEDVNCNKNNYIAISHSLRGRNKFQGNGLISRFKKGTRQHAGERLAHLTENEAVDKITQDSQYAHVPGLTTAFADQQFSGSLFYVHLFLFLKQGSHTDLKLAMQSRITFSFRCLQLKIADINRLLQGSSVVLSTKPRAPSCQASTPQSYILSSSESWTKIKLLRYSQIRQQSTRR